MNCDYFGRCGSCTLGGKTYGEQLNVKVNIESKRFQDLYSDKIDVIKSEDGKFRNRAEFRIWKIFDENNNFTLHYAMNDIDKKALVIDSCSIVNESIHTLMPKLIKELVLVDALNFKLFTCEFLTSTTNDILVTLIYHKKLDESWEKEARKIEEKLNIKIIGRSRKQKVILSDDCINEELTILNNTFKIKYQEGGFTQPNQKVNIQMIEWVLNNIDAKDDLCELYCGGGNFTLPLSKVFNKVLATEISKTSIRSAKINCTLNDISNIKFIRMSSEEFVEARNKVRTFRRMTLENVVLDDYNFSTIFVDPPRAGLDDTTRELSSKFNQIIYISCNPVTLKRDLVDLSETHTIKNFAFFDQFAYSNHIECGVILEKKV
ncbi:MAG TPA: tRNA (uridine(54)-C5)-methyltransferase TrmA [Arcobacter sp.]|nr:tRNA (uridine(54)-C5)-methyltransferase TrmA [Arcobacter sp.]HIP56284.1 tRNA (uridine(54)-C5)-methyltransferase TrmA [Arcobacter sp.]